MVYQHHTTWSEVVLHTEQTSSFLFLTGVTIGIEPPRHVNVTEGVNDTVEYCVVVTEPDMSAVINRTNFFVCVSTVDGTAEGKSITCMSHLSFPFQRTVLHWCCDDKLLSFV